MSSPAERGKRERAVPVSIGVAAGRHTCSASVCPRPFNAPVDQCLRCWASLFAGKKGKPAPLPANLPAQASKYRTEGKKKSPIVSCLILSPRGIKKKGR